MKGIKGAAIVGALAVAYLHFAHNIFYAYITRQEVILMRMSKLLDFISYKSYAIY